MHIYTYSDKLFRKKASFHYSASSGITKNTQMSHSLMPISYGVLYKKTPWTVKYVLPANEWICTIHCFTHRQKYQNNCAERRVKAPSGYLGHKGWWYINLIWLGIPNRSKSIKYRVYWIPLTGLLRDKGKTGGAIVIQTTGKIVLFQYHVSRRTSIAYRVERVMVLRWSLLPHWKRLL